MCIPQQGARIALQGANPTSRRPRNGLRKMWGGIRLGGGDFRGGDVAPSPAAQDVRDERLGDALTERDLRLGAPARVLGADGADPVLVELGQRVLRPVD